MNEYNPISTSWKPERQASPPYPVKIDSVFTGRGIPLPCLFFPVDRFGPFPAAGSASGLLTVLPALIEFLFSTRIRIRRFP
jgi:hypothetical protein